MSIIDERIDAQHLLEEDDDDDTYRRASRTSPQGVTKLLLGLTTAVLGLLCLVLGAALYRTSGDDARLSRHPSPIPSMPKIMSVFQPDDVFAGPSTQENDQAWNAMMPRGDGFIIVDHPADYGLPPGKKVDTGEVFDLSLFHQLHCLSGIRRHLLLLQASIGRNNSEEIQRVLLDPQWPHVYHCFDYLRQGVMCAGDMTIEWPRVESDGRRFAFDGWGVAHQCKSWDAIMTFMEEHDVAGSVRT